jgi:hypothetical protein
MSYSEHWRALAARIRSLTAAAQVYAQFMAVNTSDSYGIGKNLAQHCKSVLSAIDDFVQSFRTTLPSDTLAALDSFLKGHQAQTIKSGQEGDVARAGLVFLSALEAEISFLLSGRQELIRARSERAFLHLKRTLVVDGDARAKWHKAYKNGEPACEGLGAVHLLWHGMWAFKVSSKGITDLVFNEPFEDLEQRGVEGLVLTEWKLADEKNANDRFAEARQQAELYREGALGGIELKGFRYLVAVSVNDLSAVPGDQIVNDVVYRHINIAIKPRNPSEQARVTARRLRRPRNL